MKKEEVPQDNRYLGKTTMRDLYYAVDEDGNYCTVSSVGWEAKNDALSITWESLSEKAESIRQEVIEGKKSPLAYHIEKALMDVSLLSAYSGIPKKKIREHLTPEAFAKADENTLKIYSKTLDISLDELKSV
jgi:hypothetical protein